MGTVIGQEFRREIERLRAELEATPAELADTPWRTGGWTRKQIVGHRLALNAEAIAYGKTLVSTGPLFKGAVPAGDSITVSFDSAVGLKAVGGPLGGFEVAGADGVFSPGEAKIVGDTVVVKSAAVASPAFVRYSWAAWPVGANLYNGADLPASPFTSQ